jgi:hypothetical protein
MGLFFLLSFFPSILTNPSKLGKNLPSITLSLCLILSPGCAYQWNIDDEKFAGKKTTDELNPSQQRTHKSLCDTQALRKIFEQNGLGREIPDAFCRGDYSEAAKLLSKLPDDKVDSVLAGLHARGYDAEINKTVSTLGKAVIVTGGAVALFFIITAATGNWPFDDDGSSGGETGTTGSSGAITDIRTKGPCNRGNPECR